MPPVTRTAMLGRLLIIGLMLMLITPPASAAFKYLREGMTAPKIVGHDLRTGSQVSTQAWTGDNMIVIVFWASWSDRSVAQLRDVKSIMQERPDLAVKYLAVNVDGEKLTAPEREYISALISDLDLPFPAIIDEGLEIFYKFGVIAVPSTAIVDTTGILRYGPAGYSLTTRDRIVDSIDVILGLVEPTALTEVVEGYRPTLKASRYSRMALNQLKRRQYSRALKNLQLAEAADTGFAMPHLLRGEVLLALDSTAEAIAAYGRAVELDSGSVVAWTGWGIAFLRAGLPDSAGVRLTRALEMDDTYTPASLNLGISLAERGQFEAALDSLQRARDLNRADPRIHYYVGRVHMKTGNTGEAVAAFRTALELIYPAP